MRVSCKLLEKVFAALLFVGLAQTACGLDSFTAMELEDQWGKPTLLDKQVKLVLFSHHKKGGQWVKTGLESLQLSDLKARHWLYVADISGMPKMISRMFALPKMRKYTFPVALVKNSELVAAWPKQKQQVSVYQVEALTIKQIRYFDSADKLHAFLKSLVTEKEN